MKLVKSTQLHSVPATAETARGRDTEGVNFDALSAYHAYGVFHLPAVPMTGTYSGVLKVAAKRIGVSFNEYLSRLANGFRWCTACKDWHRIDAFVPDRSRGFGVQATCKDMFRRRPRVPRDPLKEHARAAVNNAVFRGRLPSANSVACTDCGGSWKPGLLRHEYDHYQGYDESNWLTVEVVCTLCHRAREEGRRV